MPVYDVRAPGSGLVCVFDVPRRSVVRSWSTRALHGRPSAVYGVAYSAKPGTDVVISGGSDNMLRLLDVRTGERSRDCRTKERWTPWPSVRMVFWWLRAATMRIIRVWTLAELAGSNAQPLKLVGHGATINQVSFSPADPSVLVSASDDGRIIVWR